MTQTIRRVAVGLLLVMLCAVPCSLGAEGATVIPLDRFLIKPTVREATLSPDGSRVAYLLRESFGSSVGLLDLRNEGVGEGVRLFVSRLVESLYWSTDGSGLFIATQDRLAWLPVADTPRPEVRPHWIFDLTKDPWTGTRMDSLASILGVDPIAPHHLLVTQKLEGEHHRLLRVAPDAQVEILLESQHPLNRVLLDRTSASAQRAVRYLRQPHEEPDDLGLTVWRLREAGDLGTGQAVLQCGTLDPCVPVAYAELESIDGTRRERLWMQSAGEKSLSHLYTVDITIPGDGELAVSPPRRVHGDPLGLADLDGIHVDRATGRPQLAVYDSDAHRLFGLDGRTEASTARLRQRFPEARLVVEIPVDGPHWLIEERGARLAHPRHHLYDVERETLRTLFQPERDRGRALPEDVLVEPQNISWTASDGFTVHGLLWLPQGVEPRTAPVVVRMHGGPWNHVRRQWSVVSQFLANRGYVVFEPNFRSSTGFGRDYILAAQGDFGDGRVQQDMLDGLDHLHCRGIGTPERVAIIGHSFGGFSTLGALAFTPKRFVAGVASAPPIDLVRAMRDLSDDYRIGNGLVQKDVLLPLVGDLEDPEVVGALRRKAPEARLAETERPVVIFAGGADPKVDIVDVKHYASGLHRLSLDVSLIVDDKQGHSFEHEVSIGAYLLVLERFLGRHLGGAVGEVEDRRFGAYLETRTLLSGPSLEAAMEEPF